MIVTKELALKGAAGLATAAASTAAVVYRNEISSLFSGKTLTLVELAKKVGLTCVNEEADECSIGEKINVFEEESKKWLEATAAGTSRNVKLEKNQEGYNFRFKFTVKDTNITLTKKDSSTETISVAVGATYEIKQENDGWFLKRVWDVGKLAANLGMTTCVDGDGGKVCDLASSATVNVINDATNKTVGATTSAEGKIKFVRENSYNLGFKLTVESNGDIALTGGTSGTSITSLVKTDTSYEMKFETDKWFFSKKAANG